MPGGIDPHVHLQMPFMGTYSTDDFESGTRAALAGGTTMVVDFCMPAPDGRLLDAWEMWDNKSTQGRHRLRLPHGDHLVGRAGLQRDGEVVKRGVNTFKHFMAYKGALMVRTTRCSPRSAAAPNSARCRWSMPRTAMWSPRSSRSCWPRATTGPRRTPIPARRGGGRGRQPRDHDRRHGGLPLYIVHVSCEQAHEAIRRARQKGMRVYGEPLIQHLTLDESEYQNKDWDHSARRVMSPPFRNKLHQDGLWAGLAAGSLQVVATDHCAFTTEQKRMGVGDFTKIPNGTGGLEDRLPMLWTYGVETGRLTKEEFVAATSTNIAKILNLYPKQGRDPGRRGRRHRGLGPRKGQDDQRGDAEIGHRLQRVRGQAGEGPAALHADPRPGRHP
jgi:dihydropyrimidinase